MSKFVSFFGSSSKATKKDSKHFEPSPQQESRVDHHHHHHHHGGGEEASSLSDSCEHKFKYESEFQIPSGPFAPGDSQENIIFEDALVDGMPAIKAATKEKLVERVSFEGYPDVKYMTQFLLTYRSFITASELLLLLRERCNLPVPPGLSEDEQGRFRTKLQQPVRLRVLNLIKSWVNQYTHDFVDDAQFTEEFSDFLNILIKLDGMTTGAKTLQLQLKKKGAGGTKKRELTLRSEPPKSIIPTFKDSGASLLAISPVELARQLTVIESELYRKIKPWEFLNQAWAKKGGVGAPNVLEMIHWSTRVSGFVASEIMKAPINKKIRVIQHFIQVAQALRELNNFNALMEVIAGFENAAVWRLQPFFLEVPKKYNQIMDELRVTMSTEKNNKSIREVLRLVDMPCIPYLGMFLTDLTFIEDGNPDTIKDGLINFTKRRYVATVIQEIQQYQQIPYCLNAVSIVQSYLRSFRLWDDEKLYQMSLLFMPRSAKEKSVKELEVLYLEKEKELKAQRKKESEEDVDWGPLEEVPGGYAFNQKESAENVVCDERGALIGAALPILIQRLTAHPTPGFMETFLVTWTTFCSAEEFSRLLLMRFNPPNPKNEKKVEEYQKKFVLLVKTRVVNILKSFVEKFSFHFVGSIGLINIFRPLLREIHQTAGVLSKTVERIESSLNSLAEEAQKGNGKSKYGEHLDHPRPSSGPSSKASISLHNSQEFAQQLTLIHHEIFRSLRPQCLLTLTATGTDSWSADQAWDRPLVDFLSAYVRAEKFCYDFVVSQVVLAQGKAPERAAVIETFVSLCECFANHYNYCAMVWFLSGLSSKTLRNLPMTWGAVSPASIEKFKKMQLLMKDLVNVHIFRERTYEPGDRFTKPCIPPVTSYIYNFLQRLAVPDQFDNGLINFSKREGMASLITDLMKLQKLSYSGWELNSDMESFINFQSKKLSYKGELIGRSDALVSVESKNGVGDIAGIFIPFVPPEYPPSFYSFAGNFVSCSFENPY